MRQFLDELEVCRLERQRFFKTRHPDAYRIVNLCSERAYDFDKFDGHCARYPFDDHNPAPLVRL